MKRSPLQKKKKHSRNFMVPDENVLDLRNSLSDKPKKLRTDNYTEYFETEYESHVNRSFFDGLSLSLKKWSQGRKEKKLAKKLASLHTLPLDNTMQQLLFEAQKDRLNFSHHQEFESLKSAEEKYKTIKQSLKLKKPIAVTQDSPETPKVKQETKEIKEKILQPDQESVLEPVADAPESLPAPESVSENLEKPFVFPVQQKVQKVTPEPVVEEKISYEPEKVSFQKESDSTPEVKRTLIPEMPDFSVFSRLFAFVVVCFVLLIPFVGLGFVYPTVMKSQGKVLGVSTTAIKELSSAGSAIASLDFSSADQSFDTAFENFLLAQDEVSKYDILFRVIPVKGSEGVAAQELLLAGADISAAGKYMSEAVRIGTVLQKESLVSGDVDITAVFSEVREVLLPAVEHLRSSEEHLSHVPVGVVPEEYQEVFAVVQEDFPVLISLLEDFVDTSDLFLTLLGHDTSKHYLVVFQNNQELRPTGGFMGSFAVITVDRGVVQNIDVPGGGIYDVSGQLAEDIIAPQPLHLVNPHWNIQDANWFPDFPSSAQKIMDFYEVGGGMTTDGVVAITPEVLEKILELTGPIYLRGEEITAKNVVDFIEQEKEEVKDTEAPKSILGELTPILLNKLLHLDVSEPIEILEIMDDIIKERDFMVYFRDQDLQNLVEEYDWSGEIKNSDRDYLYVNHANISGGKTDHLIEERIEHRTQISEEGKIVDTVLITRTHRGDAEDEKEGIKNTVYTRFYVPLGAKLVSAEGFSRIDPTLFHAPSDDARIDSDLREVQGEVLIDEYSGVRISQEFNKQVFGNWLSVEPGESIQAMLSYELPFQLETAGFFDQSDYYRMYVQKQPGAKASIFSSYVEIPDSLEVWWKGPKDLDFESNTFMYETVLERDSQYGFVVTP